MVQNSQGSPGSEPVLRRMPRRCQSSTQSFLVGGTKGYLTTSRYENGAVGAIDLRMAKQGSTLAGMMDALSTAVSTGLQYGAPLETYVRKLSNTRSEPSGLTNDPQLPVASSAMDYVARRLAVDYLPVDVRRELGILTAEERTGQVSDGTAELFVGWSMDAARDRQGSHGQ
jgi:ribonucleoside-diphosphate reductase alpha chain